MKALDAPSREECTAQRPRSNTPLEALVLLNDQSMVEAAVAMAVRTLDSDQQDALRLQHAFRLGTARSPDPTETESLQRLLEQERTYYAAHETEAAALVGREAYAKTDNVIELAAWTSVTRAILNLYETVARN
jgi:hypothetical protein